MPARQGSRQGVPGVEREARDGKKTPRSARSSRQRRHCLCSQRARCRFCGATASHKWRVEPPFLSYPFQPGGVMSKASIGGFVLSAMIAFASGAMAQVKIGVIVSATGPAASLGIPEKNTIALCPKTIGGKAVEYVSARRRDRYDQRGAGDAKADRREPGRRDHRHQHDARDTRDDRRGRRWRDADDLARVVDPHHRAGRRARKRGCSRRRRQT